MKAYIFSFLVILTAFSCNNKDKKSVPNPIESETTVETKDDNTKSFYYGSETDLKDYEEGAFSYQLYRFEVDGSNNVKGFIINAPYGTDGSKGNFSGTYDFAQNLIAGKEIYLAEGEIYTIDRKFSLNDNSISSIEGTKRERLLPQLSRDEFGSIYNSYRDHYLFYDVNTTDLTRVKKLAASEKWGFDSADIDKLVFREYLIDLDGKYENKAYLLYIFNDNFCGSDGCNLFVINQNGEVLSSTTVVRLPAYMKNTTVDKSTDPEVRDKDLIVWSDGAYRVLRYENKEYTSNASNAKPLSDQDIAFHPEKYTMIFDY